MFRVMRYLGDVDIRLSAQVDQMGTVPVGEVELRRWRDLRDLVEVFELRHRPPGGDERVAHSVLTDEELFRGGRAAVVQLLFDLAHRLQVPPHLVRDYVRAELPALTDTVERSTAAVRSIGAAARQAGEALGQLAPRLDQHVELWTHYGDQVLFTAPCPRCGQDTTWEHHQDRPLRPKIWDTCCGV